MQTELYTAIMENKKLIYSVAHQFKRPDLMEDLFQVGCIGIINAIKNYNPSYQVKFSTYAYPYIEGEMKKFLRENRSIKISREMNSLQLKIEKASILLSQRLMREPTYHELAQFLEIPDYMVSEAIHSKDTLKSIDEPICEDGKIITLHDTIGNTLSMDLNTLIALREEISALDPVERTLIEKRYMEDRTQSEIAKALGMSQVQVSRKEQKVLVKLKDKLVV